MATGGGQKYLYSNKAEFDSPGYVVEYKGDPDGRNRPSFLYEPESDDDAKHSPPPARVVEFYAPWCPHCRHYAPLYIQLAADATEMQPSVKFYAVSCVAHKDICKDQEVHGFPTLKLYREGSYEVHNVTKGVKIKEDANALLKELGFMEGGGDDTTAVGKSSSHDSKKEAIVDREKARVVPFAMHEVHDAWWDASLSFEFALKNGIYMENGPLPREKAKALREWLEILSMSLPSQMGRTRDVVDAMLAEFPRASSGQENLDDVVRDTVPSDPSWTWRTCTYGDNSMGYTCGLWQLFHVVSVGVVEYNRHSNADDDDDGPLPTGRVADALRNYVDHFFQCDVCRLNFLDMYDSCAFDGCHRLSGEPSSSEGEWKELPLWLWETHNDVNTRLLGERLEQRNEAEPSHWETQQARWPALYTCPDCWREDGSWEEEEIFRHLHSMYYSGNASYIKIPSEGGVGAVGATTLRWKLSAIILAVVALLARLSTSKKVRHSSGRHKK